MFEQKGCVWCQRFDREIAPAYDKTTEGKRAPLRRVDIAKPLPRDLRFIRRERFTPVFVLVENGREFGRIRGYPGETFFWGLLANLIERLDRGEPAPRDRDAAPPPRRDLRRVIAALRARQLDGNAIDRHGWRSEGRRARGSRRPRSARGDAVGASRCRSKATRGTAVIAKAGVGWPTATATPPPARACRRWPFASSPTGLKTAKHCRAERCHPGQAPQRGARAGTHRSALAPCRDIGFAALPG